jgi:Terpene cyclase DEP1
MTATTQAAGLPTSSKVLCAVYALIAVAALIATWSQNLAYGDRGASFIAAFWEDTKVTPASRSITVDIALFALAAAILMVLEARKHGVKFVWLYIIGGLLVAISVTFPLFLIAREIRIGRTDPARMGSADTIGLAILAVGTAAFTIWVDVL